MQQAKPDLFWSDDVKSTEEHPFRPPLSITLPEILQDNSDKAFRRAIYALLVSMGRLAVCRAAFGREVGLSGTQYTVLMATAHLQGNSGVSIRGLSDYMHMAAPNVTTEVRKLVELGLLRKRASNSDRRAVQVTLTSAGETTLERVAPMLREINDILFAGITREEFLVLSGILERFVANTGRAVARIAERDAMRRTLDAAGLMSGGHTTAGGEGEGHA